jgi:hypothetical protein
MRVTVASVLTAAAFCITADAAVAQDSTKVPRVGVLASTSGPGGLDDGLFQGLRDLGYIDGRNIILHVRWGAGRPEQYSAFAAELIGLGVDVIVGSGARCEAAFARYPRLILANSNCSNALLARGTRSGALNTKYGRESSL